MRVRYLACALFAGALSGCATSILSPSAPLQVDAQAQWEARRAQLTPRDTWAFEGRVAVQRGNEGGQARIHWTQTGPEFELRIVAPLGQGTTTLHGTESAVELVTSDGKHFSAPDLATLMTTHLQWNLPVAGARYWVLGLPIPTHLSTSLRLNPTGLMTDVAQDGWRISVTDYQTVDGLPLPRKLFLLGNNLELRMVISQWLTPPH